MIYKYIHSGQDQNRIKLRLISPKLGFTDPMLLKQKCLMGPSKFGQTGSALPVWRENKWIAQKHILALIT